MTQEDPPPPQSPWVQAAQRAQAEREAAKPPRYEMWSSVGLGVLAGAGGVLLLGALLMMLGR